MLNEYDKKEQIGRDKMTILFNEIFSKYNADIKYYSYEYATSDARINFYNNNGEIYKTIVVEIKVRDNYSDRDSLILEYHKYKELLIERAIIRRDEEINDVKIWYVNFIDDIVYIFSLNDDIKFTKIYCRENNITDKKRIKEVTFLNKSEAKLYKYKK